MCVHYVQFLGSPVPISLAKFSHLRCFQSPFLGFSHQNWSWAVDSPGEKARPWCAGSVGISRTQVRFPCVQKGEKGWESTWVAGLGGVDLQTQSHVRVLRLEGQMEHLPESGHQQSQRVGLSFQREYGQTERGPQPSILILPGTLTQPGAPFWWPLCHQRTPQLPADIQDSFICHKAFYSTIRKVLKQSSSLLC